MPLSPALPRRAALAAVLLTGAVGLSACWTGGSVTPQQAGVGAPVVLETHIGFVDDCHQSQVDPQGETRTIDCPEQPMLGFQVPIGAPAPGSFATLGADPRAFRRDAAYAAALEERLPAAGLEWIGYLGEVTPKAPFTVAPSFELPRPGGAQFQGPFRYRTIIGYREVDATLTADRAIDCDDADTTYCTGEPGPGGPVEPEAPGLTEFAASDAALIAPPEPAPAEPGAPAALVFPLDVSGTPEEAEAEPVVTGSTTVAGGRVTVTLSEDDLPATAAGWIANASVEVPGGTPDGDYGVTITAAFPGGVTRSATRTLRVATRPPAPAPAPDPPAGPAAPQDEPCTDRRAPVLAGAGLTPRRLAARSALVVRVQVDEPSALAIRLSRGTGTDAERLVRRTLPAGRHRIIVPPATVGTALGTRRVSVTATDCAGNRSRTLARRLEVRGSSRRAPTR